MFAACFGVLKVQKAESWSYNESLWYGKIDTIQRGIKEGATV